ncbi:hypothetical protein GBF35_00595 [Nonomuraea phyllanthi]|uniref:hypothetical protein n=1 Tax=Nonomuraea phyllanthi TaxID=2219224 RepID=UPI0012940321|nr:hypothetical protein [Nonomuraea phyllanthi]QFY05380.1 hypothetical protein GBF35_00595 [Nonomuraea phyllanthi]
MKIAKLAAVAAPLLMLAYGIIRLVGRMDGVYGPGLDWQAAHLANLAGLILFVPLVLAIRRLLAPGWVREAVVVVSLVGAATSIVQFVADIVEGLLAADKAGMRELSAQFHSMPGVDLAFYQVGPQLLYIGMIALTAMLARERTLPWWSVAVVLVSSLLPLATLNLIPVSAAGYLVALVPLWRPLERQDTARLATS